MAILSLLRPGPQAADRLKAESDKLSFNYDVPGCTRDATPDDLKATTKGWLWSVDSTRCKLGEGQDTFKQAKALLQRWAQFQLGWSQVDASTPIVEGGSVAVVAKTLFLWSANPLRIVYVNETKAGRNRHSPAGQLVVRGRHSHQGLQRWHFAHGCLAGHLLSGEECFRLDWDPHDNSVWYEVLTVSRPVHPLAVLSYPITRFFQARFARESAAALQSALHATSPQPQEASAHAAGTMRGAPPAACLTAAWCRPWPVFNSPEAADNDGEDRLGSSTVRLIAPGGSLWATTTPLLSSLQGRGQV